MTQPIWTDMLAGESMLEWLQRTDTDRTWFADPNNGQPIARLGAPETTAYHFWLRPTFTEDQFAQQRDRVLDVPVTPTLPPVYPGDGYITYGTPVALVDQLVVEEPMDGLLVVVTTPPQHLGSYRLGGVILDYGVGRVAFESEEGHLETWQYLGFRDAVYTPKTLAHAERARFQVLGGAEGTVTPWRVGTFPS